MQLFDFRLITVHLLKVKLLKIHFKNVSRETLIKNINFTFFHNYFPGNNYNDYLFYNFKYISI